MFFYLPTSTIFATVDEFVTHFAMTSFGDLSKRDYREAIGLFDLLDDRPAYDHITHKLIPGNVELENGSWYRRWQIVPMTTEEATLYKQSIVPQAVTMRQARLALLSINKLAEVAPFINSLPEPIKSKASIEWEYSQEVQRLNGSVSVIGPGIGLTPDQIDDLFILAATL